MLLQAKHSAGCDLGDRVSYCFTSLLIRQLKLLFCTLRTGAMTRQFLADVTSAAVIISTITCQAVEALLSVVSKHPLIETSVKFPYLIALTSFTYWDLT